MIRLSEKIKIALLLNPENCLFGSARGKFFVDLILDGKSFEMAGGLIKRQGDGKVLGDSFGSMRGYLSISSLG